MIEIELTSIRFLTDDSGAPLNPRGKVGDTTALQRSLSMGQQYDPIEGFWREGVFYVLDGHRRTTAARALGWKTIKAQEKPEPPTTSAILLAMLISQDQEPVKPSGEALAMKRILEDDGWTVERLSAARQKTPMQIRQFLALLDAPEDVRRRVDSGDLSWSAWERIYSKPADFQQQVAALDKPDVRGVKKLISATKHGGTSAAASAARADDEDEDDSDSVVERLNDCLADLRVDWDDLDSTSQTRVRVIVERLNMLVGMAVPA